jgi:hypothetical protein
MRALCGTLNPAIAWQEQFVAQSAGRNCNALKGVNRDVASLPLDMRAKGSMEAGFERQCHLGPSPVMPIGDDVLGKSLTDGRRGDLLALRLLHC